MSRPQKQGLDYFPHDVDASNDPKIEALQMLYGFEGYAFYFKMLECLYRTEGCEIIISDAETREEIMQILSRKTAETREKFDRMLNTALRHGCFNKELFDKGIITSNGAKKRADSITNKRSIERIKYKERINKVNKRKGKEKKHTTFCNDSDAEISQKQKITANFKIFWDIYPKKIGKSAAEKSFLKINPLDELFNIIINAVKTQKEWEQWKIDNGKFIPNASSWLNGKRWEDEIPQVKNNGHKQELIKNESIDEKLEKRGIKLD